MKKNKQKKSVLTLVPSDVEVGGSELIGRTESDDPSTLHVGWYGPIKIKLIKDLCPKARQYNESHKNMRTGLH